MARKLQLIGSLLSGEIDPEKVKELVDDYLEENPPTPNITINGEKPDANGNFVIELKPSDGESGSGSDTNNVVEF